VDLVERIKQVLMDPRKTWVTIATEPASVQGLYTNWIMILAAIGPLALLLSVHSVQLAIALYLRSLIVTFVLALVVDTLAPSFGGTKDFIASLKLVAYSFTVVWLAGIFNLAGMLGELAGLIAIVYTLYTFYLGAPLLNRATPDKTVSFTLVVVLCAIVLFFLARFAFAGLIAAPAMHPAVGMSLR